MKRPHRDVVIKFWRFVNRPVWRGRATGGIEKLVGGDPELCDRYSSGKFSCAQSTKILLGHPPR
jgi:hypothetical protein